MGGMCCTADEVGARYCEDCHVAEVNDDPSAKAGVRSYALNPEHAKALWAKTDARFPTEKRSASLQVMRL